MNDEVLQYSPREVQANTLNPSDLKFKSKLDI